MFFFSFTVRFGDGGFASKESPPSESSDSSEELLASGFKGRGGGKAKSWGHGGQGLGLFTHGRTGALGFT